MVDCDYGLMLVAAAMASDPSRSGFEHRVRGSYPGFALKAVPSTSRELE